MTVIGLDMRAFRAPYTGIPHYALWLLDALMRLQSDHSFVGFGDLQWQNIDRRFIDSCISDASNSNAYLARAESSGRRNRTATLRRAVRAMPSVHSLAARLRGAAFLSSIGSRNIKLFHAFRYKAPVRQLSVPVIPVVHDLSYLRHPELHPAARVRWMKDVELVCRDASVVHTVSKFTAMEISREFGVSLDRIAIIPPAVRASFRTVDDTGSSILMRHDLHPASYALTVSTLEPRKNLKTLVSAYGRLTAGQRRRMPLVVVGADGWGGVDLRSDPLVLSGDIKMLGYVSDADLATLYRGARVMLYPSIYEGFGMPITEAMACGAPVVASDAASMPEALAGTGRLVAPLDVEGWTDAILSALHDEEALTENQRAARVAVATEWTWNAAAVKTLQLYRSVL